MQRPPAEVMAGRRVVGLGVLARSPRSLGLGQALGPLLVLTRRRHRAVDDRLFGVTEEQAALRAAVASFCRREVAPLAAALDRENGLPAGQRRRLWRQLGEFGMFGITASSKYGGTDMAFMDQVIVVEELTRASPSIAASYLAQSNLCINNLNTNGTEEQKVRLLPALCRREACGALAMSEPGAGSDVVGGMATAAAWDGDAWLLNGSKCWITKGPDCDVTVSPKY